jgi:hypothetical protein
VNWGFLQKRYRSIKRGLRGKTPALAVLVFILIGIFVYATYMQNKRLTVDSATYAPLLQLIAKVESKGNYNAYFGNASNSSINFTAMSIAEVMKWQSDHVSQGNLSSAVGKYQIVDKTLSGLVRQLGIDTSQMFDQTMQDQLAIALLERRGAESYINQELTRDQFAANLAKEWAALPKVIGEKPGASYYAGDGLNKSLVSVNEVMKAIEPIRPSN